MRAQLDVTVGVLMWIERVKGPYGDADRLGCVDCEQGGRTDRSRCRRRRIECSRRITKAQQ